MLSNLLSYEQVEAVKVLIESAQHVVILTHMSPDGDAIGSSLALYHYLESKGKKAQVIVPNSFPNFLNWMPASDQIIQYDQNPGMASQCLDQAELIICTDFNEPKRIGILGEMMLQKGCKKIMIDHHLNPSLFADICISYPSSPSASELVYRLLYQLGEIDQAKDKKSIFECIYTGMMTDTGNFSFNSNYPQMYEIVGDLVAHGVNKDAIYNAVYNAYSEDRMRLMGYCLYQKMRIFPEHHTALIYLNRKELYRFNFQGGDAEGIVNLPLQIKDIYYSCFMREDKVNPAEEALANGSKIKVKISLRSQGDRPVNIFARDIYNGGGHANASGGEYYGPIDEAAQRFIDHYATYFSKD